MEDEGQVANDRQRAEVFDALGHPTRIVILKALGEGALGFADLKKKTAIDSSGHLQHHLTKLNGLIKTDEYGKYCLSDQGKDALLTVQTVESTSLKSTISEKTHKRHFNAKIGLKPLAFLLVALLIASSAIALFEYNQAISLRKENTFFNGVNPEAAAYYNSQFGSIVPTTNVNSSFAPPISIYQALLIGLESQGYTKTLLQGTSISINLLPWYLIANSTSGTIQGGGFNSQLTMTNPPENYSDIYSNGVIYLYVWEIDIQKTDLLSLSNSVVPQQVLVDASTGAIVTGISH